MTRLKWDQVGARIYESGVDLGILYVRDEDGLYTLGYAWNGLVKVTESPSGAEANKQYADNIQYLTLVSTEEFNATIEAFTYPYEFNQFDGVAEPEPGVLISQQNRRSFGFVYHTRIGDDVVGDTLGYKIHLIYNALASPSEKSYGTINDSPEIITFSWDITTTPISIVGYKPAASVVIDSRKVDPLLLGDLQDILYGTVDTDPRLPLIDEIISMLSGGGLLTEDGSFLAAEDESLLYTDAI